MAAVDVLLGDNSVQLQEKDLASLIAELELNPPDEERVLAFQRSIAQKASDPTFRIQIREEMKNLSATVLQIENDFAKIGDALRIIDEKERLRDTKGNILKFQPQWVKIHEFYTELLFNSQMTAIRLRAKIEDMLKNIIPLFHDPNVSFDDKKLELQIYIEELDEIHRNSCDKAREFLRLGQAINNFKDFMISNVTRNGKETQNCIDVINTNLGILRAKLQRLESFLSALSNIFAPNTLKVVGCASFGVGAILALKAVAPWAAGILLIAGVGALGFGIKASMEERKQEINKTRQEIQNLERQRDDWRVHRKEIQAINSDIRSLNGTFDSVLTRIGTMQQIWGLIRSDAIELQESMHAMKRAGTRAGFMQRIENVEKLWNMLAWSLDNYALTVAFN